MKVQLFDFALPDSLIALQPAEPRESARMLAVPAEGDFSEKVIGDFPEFLQAGDVLVINDTRVIPARLFGQRGAARVEVLLHKKVSSSPPCAGTSSVFSGTKGMIDSSLNDRFTLSPKIPAQGGEDGLRWQAFAKPAKRLRIGDEVSFAEGFSATVIGKMESGEVVLRFPLAEAEFYAALNAHGAMPLPPYIQSKRAADAGDQANYQTVYHRHAGSVAAPTAGLHLTEKMLKAVADKGVKVVRVTLHVGAGTFQPVKVEDTREHVMHSEWAEVSAAAAAAINAARAACGRVVAVGTTSLRTLESAADAEGAVRSFAGETDIFITPGYAFKCVDVLLTNFHLPKSTLFMLVSAFSGLEWMQAAYAHAMRESYRFYSYGDACLLERSDRHPRA